MQIQSGFSVEEITEQTKRILSFAMFRNSPVLSRFLEFIISETIHKKETLIKEYSIAINVLYRSRDFNPNVDSIVRIHAGRLRRALNDYYLTQGIYDPIIIHIPKGCYIPEFTGIDTLKDTVEHLPVLKTLPSPEIGNKPRLAVFPFSVTTERAGINEFLSLLKEQLSGELLNFGAVTVIGYYPDTMRAKIKENILEAGKSAGADYIITGSATCVAERLRLMVNLLVTSTGEILLCKSTDINISTTDSFEILDHLMEKFIGFAGDCYVNILHGWHREE